MKHTRSHPKSYAVDTIIALLPLSGDAQGSCAIIDPEDVERINALERRWRLLHGYVACQTRIFESPTRRIIRLHRFVIQAPDRLVVDHINHDLLDNRKCNLRICTQSQNMMNQRPRSTQMTSAFKGVSWNPNSKGWLASIGTGASRIHLGKFGDPISAAGAYDRAALKMFGEFACLNFPEGRAA